MYPNSKKQAIKILLATTLSLLLSNAIAGQTLVAKPGETLSAVVSRTEPTMIKIQGHKVRRVFGKKGDFTLTPDKEPGVAYLTPTSDKPTFSIFVSDETGRTWTVLLSVQDTLSDIILIKETGIGSTTPQKGHQLPRENSIKQMLLSLASTSSGENEDAQDVNEVVPLWSEALFVKVKIIKGNSLLGEKYLLTNISKKPMVIDERELYRNGVVSIAVDQPNLQPAESTSVYVISNNTEAE